MATEAEKLRDDCWFAPFEIYEYRRFRKSKGEPPLTESEEGLLRDFLVMQHASKSKTASESASAPRKKYDKKSAYNLWAEWQKSPSRYKNKQQYISDVMEKFGVAQNTAREWFEFFMGYRTDEWCALFGEKYPPKIKEK